MRRARHVGTGAALPLSACSPAGSNAIAPEAARNVDSPTSTVDGAAADCRRAAVFTMSPATIPWFVAPMVTAASPVRTPQRASIPGATAGTAATSSRPARTARSASSSCVVGVPQTAMTASPMNFSTTPPWRVIVSVAMPKYRVSASRTSSASRPSEKGVNPTRSANRTLTRRRSATGAANVAGGATGVAGARRHPRSVPAPGRLVGRPVASTSSLARSPSRARCRTGRRTDDPAG